MRAEPFVDGFDSFNQSFWYASDFLLAATWKQTAWDETYGVVAPGELVLTFDDDAGGKPFTGSEIQSGFYTYGTYEVEMIKSGVESSFFLFTSE